MCHIVFQISNWVSSLGKLIQGPHYWKKTHFLFYICWNTTFIGERYPFMLNKYLCFLHESKPALGSNCKNIYFLFLHQPQFPLSLPPTHTHTSPACFAYKVLEHRRWMENQVSLQRTAPSANFIHLKFENEDKWGTDLVLFHVTELSGFLSWLESSCFRPSWFHC